ncbi:cell polarity protein [Schistosoma mansoni]|uniref:cell polarity protein n=1 Tax=Schistosoma mansoni TaxID=6183 RepID=UPI00022DCAFA|nr:cell polarity protein [Schistosoma mansoni]|eukprot:XP_018655416.1 cell polarity protein [Schistosoma mansoni]
MENQKDRNLEFYAEEVRKRQDLEKEKEGEKEFLRTSLRASSRLQAIEKYRRIIKKDEYKRSEVNQAFEDDSKAESSPELTELLCYLRTKMPVPREEKENKFQSSDVTLPTNETTLDLETEQWEWLLNVLSDPNLSKAFLMHDKVAKAYETCKSVMHPKPRYRWPVLAGLAYDTMEAVKERLLTALKNPGQFDAFTLNCISAILNLCSSPLFQNLLIAMDGLANTWLFDADDDFVASESLKLSDDIDRNSISSSYIQKSSVPGCYATLAYDDQGRDSYSEHGVRLKYVILQKTGNEFLGATVRLERNSVLIARIVNGGLACKTNLLHEGDELLSVNGIELLGKDLNTVCDIMASLQGRIVLLVAPALDPYSSVSTKGIIGNLTRLSDEERGLSGAIGTLAGLIPSPIYQRNRAILRLKYWLTSGTEDIEFEEDSTDSDSTGSTVIKTEKPTNKSREKKFLGIKFPTLKNTHFSSRSTSPSGRDTNQTDSKSELTSVDTSEGDLTNGVVYTPEDDSRCVMNSTVLSSAYGDRMSGLTKPTDLSSANAINEWSAAGPVWGQHGYNLRTLCARRKRNRRKLSSTNRSSLCLEGLKSWKKDKKHGEYCPFLVPDNELQSSDDPVAWLDKEVARGYMIHYSLWTYEPVAQYIPQPLRRRPLVFVGPAHVGRQQILQHLIQREPDRFYQAAIYTTNSNLKTDTKFSYICITEEEFRLKRKQKEFIEWGLFNRDYYGTSKLTVRQLVNEGKICCISLRPDSLRKIRSSGLDPYVIFISPPERVDDLQRLRKNLNLAGNCSNDELKACIETSRKMELRFGHWFDRVIIPETLDTTVTELIRLAIKLEREPTWVPRYWLDLE